MRKARQAKKDQKVRDKVSVKEEQKKRKEARQHKAEDRKRLLETIMGKRVKAWLKASTLTTTVAKSPPRRQNKAKTIQ